MINETILAKLKSDYPEVYVLDIKESLRNNYNNYDVAYADLKYKMTLNALRMKASYQRPKKTECSCCCEEELEENAIKCDAGHAVCVKCFVCYSRNMMYQQKSTKFKCIDCNHQCAHLYEYSKFEHAYTEQLKKEYANVQKFESMMDVVNEDPSIELKQCSHCYECVDIGGTTTRNEMTCVYCGKDTCLLCNEKSHNGKPCEINTSERLSKEEKLTIENSIKCTKCHNRIMKEDGCNKLTCICKNTYCFVCKTQISKDRYDHYRQGGCPLYYSR